MSSLDPKKLHNFIKDKHYNATINYLYQKYDDIERILQSTPVEKNTKKKTLLMDLLDGNMTSTMAKRVIYFLCKELNIIKLDGVNEYPHDEHLKERLNDRFFTNSANNKHMIQLFLLQLLVFNYEAKIQYKKHKPCFVGIDYEFNSQKIALCQICLFCLRHNTFTKYYMVPILSIFPTCSKNCSAITMM